MCVYLCAEVCITTPVLAGVSACSSRHRVREKKKQDVSGVSRVYECSSKAKEMDQPPPEQTTIAGSKQDIRANNP